MFKPDRKTYIAQLEALAAVLVFTTFGALLRGRKVYAWIDNTVALSAAVHGYANQPDLADASNALHCAGRGVRAGVRPVLRVGRVEGQLGGRAVAAFVGVGRPRAPGHAPRAARLPDGGGVGCAGAAAEPRVRAPGTLLMHSLARARSWPALVCCVYAVRRWPTDVAQSLPRPHIGATGATDCPRSCWFLGRGTRGARSRTPSGVTCLVTMRPVAACDYVALAPTHRFYGPVAVSYRIHRDDAVR